MNIMEMIEQINMLLHISLPVAMTSKTLQGYQLMLALLTILIIGWRISVHKRRMIEQRERAFQKTLLEELGKIPSEYHVINYVRIRTDKGVLTADHLVFSRYGIFIIMEEMNDGKITGTDVQDEWMACTKHYATAFDNPFNRLLTKRILLSRLTDAGTKCIIPIAVFNDDAELKIKYSFPIVNSKDLASTIMSYKDETISDRLLQKIESKLNVRQEMNNNPQEEL